MAEMEEGTSSWWQKKPDQCFAVLFLGRARRSRDGLMKSCLHHRHWCAYDTIRVGARRNWRRTFDFLNCMTHNPRRFFLCEIRPCRN